MIFGEIEENDDKVRSVYGGSVGEAACRNQARSCAPKPGRVPKRPGPARPHGEVRSGPAASQRGQAGPGPGRRRERDGKDGLDNDRDHMCM